MRRLGVYPTPIGPGDPGYCMDKSLGKYPLPKIAYMYVCPYLLSSETTAKGTGLEKLAGKEDPVELDSSLAL